MPRRPPPKLKFLNVVDARGNAAGGRRTIMYEGGLHPTDNGFCYTFEFDTGEDYSLAGVGFVLNPAYAGLSSQEIELACSVADPVTPEEVLAKCEAEGVDSRIRARLAGEYAPRGK